jgi:hypothetical protein
MPLSLLDEFDHNSACFIWRIDERIGIFLEAEALK